MQGELQAVTKHPMSAATRRAGAVIPIQALSNEVATRLSAAPILAMLPAPVPIVALRAPDPLDASRWRQHVIGGRAYRVAQPVTFTPYASAKPCSARCRFCSETLVERGAARPASGLRPSGAYFDQLREALAQLRGLPISYSLSGLETTDDPAWMLRMLDALDEHAASSPVQQRVLYSNGAGFVHPEQGQQLIDRLHAFRLDWVELSRHHPDAAANQAIMRFRPGVAVQNEDGFGAMLRRLAAQLPVKLVCIVQDGGVANAAGVMRYLAWARSMGVQAVIFREFSGLDEGYVENVTARYIGSARVPMTSLLAQCLEQQDFMRRFTFELVTEGYYFWNLIGRYGDMRVTFEASDYGRMHKQHGSGNVYKLVFHANGKLCADWNPERNVLFDAGRREVVHG